MSTMLWVGLDLADPLAMIFGTASPARPSAQEV